MKILKPGDHQRAYTPEGIPVEVIFEFQTIHLEDLDLDVPNILVGVNPTHQNIRVIPAQSVAKLAASRRETKERLVVTQIPKMFEDITAVLAARYGTHVSDFQPFLVRHYLWHAKENAKIAGRLCKLAELDIAKNGPMIQFKVRVPNELGAWLWGSSNGRGWHTALVRGAILAAKEDLLDRPKSKQAQTFAEIARGLVRPNRANSGL